MSTLSDYRAYREVVERVDEVRARLRAIRVAEGLAALAVVLSATVLVATAAQGYLRFGTAGRLALLVAGLATVAVALWRCVVRAVRWDPNEKEVARYLETRLPQLGNNLINTILLAEDADRWSGALVERAIGEAAAEARGVDLAQAVSHRRLRRWTLAAVSAAVLLAAFIVFQYGRFSSGALQVLMPLSHVPSVGDVTFDQIAPGDVAWIKGEPLDIEATIRQAGGGPYKAFVETADASPGSPSRKDLVRDAARPARFSYRVPQVLQPFTYMVSVGGTESRLFRVTLRESPAIQSVDLVYNYPAYTGLPPETVKASDGEVRCLVGTTVEMRIHVSSPTTGGNLLFGSGGTSVCMPDDAGKILTSRFTVLRNDTYQIRLGGQAPDTAAVVYRITALADDPPTVQFTVPGRDVPAPPGDTVKMILKAADRYGLDEVRLMMLGPGEREPRAVTTWRTFADRRDAVLDYAFAVSPARYKLGQTILYWAEATDRRTYQGASTPKGPNLATTARFKITVEDPKAAAEQKLVQLARLFERLREILKVQEQARTGTSALVPMKKADEVRAAGAALQASQKSIRQATVNVTRQVTFDSETMPLRETLEVLAANEMASAMTKAKAIADLEASRLATTPALAKLLASDQDAIIAVLRRLLDITMKLSDAIRAEEKRLAPSDLPPETLAKLKALHDRLKDFLDQQKKVIEASRDLAKKPVDDFQNTDQKQLEQLKAIEDQWDKFLTEQIADFSKIPEVDASNPSLIKELIELKTDVEMAADALSKKATDVVVPLEELGMEAAKEIVENLERWLPDTPDRQRWKQEEFTGDVEIPHAELPEQMEDLVGDLLEQEEDLFDEMQDVTSGAADSADKGAGWDAMDGPISNFSAKGVTGNQLPNSSEISGRSGEGRSGKAAGEFVEEEATGKGGRRTPTRLSPDAFSKGEVKDSSPESAGGATGGGKISGAGNEGLEGPVPAEVQRRMAGLAGKQAQLRNKAEGVKAALQVKNYDSFALQEAIEGMRKVQRDILAGRYSNALRQKNVVLDNLKGTRMLLSGEVRIRKDTSAAVPNEVRKDVLDALEKPMPRGYEEYLKRYYERLSEGN